MHDLLLSGGRVIDPAAGVDGRLDVAFADGKVAALGPRVEPLAAREVRDVSGCIVTPGLVDLHTHVYWGATSLGIEADRYARACGATTVVDAGSAGAGTFHGLRRFVAEPAATRVLAYLNISFPGIYAFSPSVMVGESEDFRLLDARECLRVAREQRDLVVGIKVRVGMSASGGRGVAPLDLAVEVADEAGLPVMCHLDLPPPGRREVLSRLRPGDVLTHCFRPFPGAPARGDGAVREEVLEARERGVIFDIGHGQGSFGFVTAEAMLAAGFRPDCISSDVHAMSVDGPAHGLLTTMTKLAHLGMTLPQVIEAATAGPARALGRPELGTLAVGTTGDASVLVERDERVELVDVRGDRRTARRRLACAGSVLAGRWRDPDPEAGPA